MRITPILALVFSLCFPAAAMAQDDLAPGAESAPVAPSHVVLPAPELPVDAPDTGDAARLRRTGGALMITGGVIGIGGTVALLLGGLSYVASGACVSPSGTCSEAKVPVGLLVAGGVGLAVGVGLLIPGVVLRSRGRRMLEEASAPSLQVGVTPSRDGGVIALSGTF